MTVKFVPVKELVKVLEIVYAMLDIPEVIVKMLCAMAK